MRTWIVKLVAGALVVVSMGYLSINMFRAQDGVAIIDSELIINDSAYKLLFFGYAGCYHFCDPRLRQIDTIYEQLKKDLDIKVLFIDISEETTLEAAVAFVNDVNREFEVINPDNENIKTLQKIFQDVYIQKMPDSEYLHSGFLYLLKRSGDRYVLEKIYLEFMQTDAVVADIKNRAGK